MSPSHTGFPNDCATCHTTTAWRPSTFDHTRTNFQLTGAHLAVACNQCHKNAVYAGTPATCGNAACHLPDYTSAANPVHGTGFSTDCITCHSTTAWRPATFDHSKASFPLTGAHVTTQCALCHKNGIYTGTPNTCGNAGCHLTQYNATMAPSHTAAAFPLECQVCHTTTAWKPSTFDHARTNFQLTGAHVAAACNLCHKNGVFAGTPAQCSGCHQAQATAVVSPSHTGFPNDCATCHTTTAWRPSTFDHARTNFQLTGAHLAVACNLCHKNGVFAGTPAQCAGCHQAQATAVVSPSHTGFPNDCATCHTTTAWRPSTFDHARTNFQLTGAHLAVACNQCHKNAVYAGTPATCGNAACHLTQYNATMAPSHTAAAFPLECQVCHTTTAWKPSTFDHARTNFQLTGAHVAAACNLCHKNGVFAGTPAQCAGCHQAQATAVVSPSHTGFPDDCATCHTTTAWRPSTFDHARTNFQLTGAHLAVACNLCHKNGVFAGTPAQCAGCHQAQATAVVTPSHTGFPNDCATCHTTTAWKPSTFDHTRTNFQLTGAHLAVACNQCHKNAVYAGTPATCGNAACHLPDYTSAANPVHGTGFSTDCITCHSTTAWRPATFDHSKASFPLTGAHVTTQCALCHKNGIYTGTPNTCGNAGCHLTQYNATASPSHAAAAFPLECQVCHSTTAWKPSTWNHDPYFPISAGSRHSPGRWNSCADCHTAPTNYTVFSCINCHEHASQSNVDGHHTEVAGYSYNSAACYHCHPQGNSGGARR